MPQSTVRNIHCTGDWVNKHTNKTMYNIMVSLEDGTMGQASAMSEKPWYSEPGTAVFYEIQDGTTPQGDKKLSIKKADDAGGGGSNSSGYSGGSRSGFIPKYHGEAIGNAITNATFLIAHGKAKANGTVGQTIFGLAKSILDEASLPLSEMGETVQKQQDLPIDRPSEQNMEEQQQAAEAKPEDIEEDVPF